MSSCPNVQVGGDCKLYYNSGTYETPTWVEIDQVGDVSIPDLGIALAEIKVRATKWNLNLPANFTAAVEFMYLYGASKTVFDALRVAFFSRAEMEFAVMDGDIATVGSEGLRLTALIENFPITQNLEDPTMVDSVRLAPAYACDAGDNLIEPAWYIVSGP